MGAIGFSLSGTLLLKLFPELAGMFGPFYAQLVKGPTWTYMAALPAVALAFYAKDLGWRRSLTFLVIGMLVGGASELIGTSTGFPFGEYVYTAWLGPKAFGHVPYFIPLSWFALSIVSFELAARVTSSGLGRILLGAFFMVLWDVSLDPAMSKAFPFWIYPSGGFFYGMPLTNWFGWMGVSLVIMAGYEYLAGGPPRAHSWALPFYVVNCAFPFLLSVLYGYPGAALYGVAATLFVIVLVTRRSGHGLAR